MVGLLLLRKCIPELETSLNSLFLLLIRIDGALVSWLLHQFLVSLGRTTYLSSIPNWSKRRSSHIMLHVHSFLFFHELLNSVQDSKNLFASETTPLAQNLSLLHDITFRNQEFLKCVQIDVLLSQNFIVLLKT